MNSAQILESEADARTARAGSRLKLIAIGAAWLIGCMPAQKPWQSPSPNKSTPSTTRNVAPPSSPSSQGYSYITLSEAHNLQRAGSTQAPSRLDPGGHADTGTLAPLSPSQAAVDGNAGADFKPTERTEREIRRLAGKDRGELVRLCKDGDGYACFFLAGLSWGEDNDLGNAANWRACDLEYVPEACAFFLTEQLSEIKIDEFLSPRKLLRIIEAACSYQREFCERLRDHSLQDAALGDIRGQFPEAVAGFTFENSMDQAKSECDGGGGLWVPPKQESPDLAGCSRLPVNSFPFGVTFAILKFCGGSLCQVAILFPAQPHLADAIMVRLRTKYSAPAPSTPVTVCGPHDASSRGPQPFRWTWTDRRADRTARQIWFDFSCDQDGSGPTTPAIWYTNVRGVRRSMKEHEERRSNF